jgi:hypothetical protein
MVISAIWIFSGPEMPVIVPLQAVGQEWAKNKDKADDPFELPVVPGCGCFTRFLLRAPDRRMIAIGRSASLPCADVCKRRRSSNADARGQRAGDEDRTGDPDG